MTASKKIKGVVHFWRNQMTRKKIRSFW